MVDFYHSFNLPVVLHTCGFVEPILDQIADAGFDALHPMEVKAGNDPLRIAAKYKDKLALVGGLLRQDRIEVERLGRSSGGCHGGGRRRRSGPSPVERG